MNRFLKKYGNAIIDRKSHSGMTALMYAVMREHVHAVALLLENGASITIKDNNGWSLLMEEHFNPEIATLLEQHMEIRRQQQKKLDGQAQITALTEDRLEQLRKLPSSRPLLKKPRHF